MSTASFHFISAVAVVLLLACTFAVQQQDDNEAMALETLKQVCDNPNGGHLNEMLVELNYSSMGRRFASSVSSQLEAAKKLLQVIEDSKREFSDALAQLNKNKRKNSASIDRLLNSHTTRLCGMLAITASATSET